MLCRQLVLLAAIQSVLLKQAGCFALVHAYFEAGLLLHSRLPDTGRPHSFGLDNTRAVPLRLRNKYVSRTGYAAIVTPSISGLFFF